MKLVLAEKPSVAQSIAKVLGAAKREDGYQNVYFDSGSEAGKFVESIYAYPTTYVVNRSGRIVGDPIVGAITSKAQADALQAQIDKALAADVG